MEEISLALARLVLLEIKPKVLFCESLELGSRSSSSSAA